MSKRFGATVALSGVDLTVFPGEIHALVGRNGSGKSTLMKVLSGFHAPDAGRVELDGREVPLPLHGPQARRLGLSFVHQDLGLIPELSVLENVKVGRHRRGSLQRISWSAARRQVAAALESFAVDADPLTRVAMLSDVDRALVGIVRSFLDLEQSGPGVLVLDEPTAFLPRNCVERLFEAVRRVAAAGTAVIFVSHRLDEVLSVADVITVLRDGCCVGTFPTATVTADDLVRSMLGSEMERLYPQAHSEAGEVLLTVHDLAGDRVAPGFGFELRAGEILGITGISGSGYEEVPALLFGAKRARSGRMVIGGRSVSLTGFSPSDARTLGLALLPADRRTASGVGSLSVGHNVSLPNLGRFTTRGRLRLGAERRYVEALLAEYDVRPGNPQLPLGALSGGNQQKALMAKWLVREPRVLLFHEPTNGVDVGAKKDIFERLVRSAIAGTSVVIASAEYEDLAHLCHRVLVLRDGVVAAELDGDSLTEARIVEESYAPSATPGTLAARHEVMS